MTDPHDMGSYFHGFMPYDLFRMMTAGHLGNGIHRTVYRSGLDKDQVVKFEHASKSFANIAEWEIWNCAKEDHPELAKWLAPCLHISHGGHILVQQYADNVGDRKMPDRIPAFFTDLKMDNWGMIGKRVVARDYANNLVSEIGLTKRMKKADWW